MRTFTSLALALLCGLTVSIGARQAHSKEPHQHAEAAKMQNPVAADAKSLEAGKKLYTDNCADCHGEGGKGDGPAAPYAGDPPPSDLTDAEWRHGSTDGEIFVIIRDGVEGTGMKDFAKDMTPTEMWHVVNYVKAFAPKPSPNH
jgi:mono/diheme cytochrome c family protein